MPSTDSMEAYVIEAEEAGTEKMRSGETRGQMMSGPGATERTLAFVLTVGAGGATWKGSHLKGCTAAEC